LEYERYMLAGCSLALMALLVVGTAGYAITRGIFRPAAIAASDRLRIELNQAADPGKAGASEALALGLVAALLAAFAATPTRIRAAVASSHAQVSFEPRPMLHAMDHSIRAARSRRRNPIDTA
jgi:hypothetical protein